MSAASIPAPDESLGAPEARRYPVTATGGGEIEYDPISLEIIWSRLNAIADEAASILLRSSFSTIIREAHDYACVLMDAEGQSLAESSVTVPAFNATMPRTMKYFLERFPKETWR